jgi:hypothetical protein
LEQNNPMLSVDQLISEATALPDAAKAILVHKNALLKLRAVQSKRFLEILPWRKFDNYLSDETRPTSGFHQYRLSHSEIRMNHDLHLSKNLHR